MFSLMQDISMLQVQREELEVDVKARDDLDSDNKAVTELHLNVFRKYLELLKHYVEKWFKVRERALLSQFHNFIK